MISTTTPSETPSYKLANNNNFLVIGGLSMPQLAPRIGQSPFYAYDRQLISQRVNDLRQQLPARIELHYALKANPMPALVQNQAGLTDGLDVASLGEMHTALDTGMKPENISYL